MYIAYGKVFGGTPNIFMFWLFPENESISERTINRALIVHTTLIKFCIKKKKKKKKKNHFHFRHVPKLYPLALKVPVASFICKVLQMYTVKFLQSEDGF